MEKNTIWPIRFPTETMKAKFKKRLSLLRIKVDINKPLYEILFDTITEALRDQMHTNSIGILPEQFSKIVNDKMNEVSGEKE